MKHTKAAKGLRALLSRSVLNDTYKKVRADRNTFLRMFFIDALFVCALFLINYMLNLIIPNPQQWVLNAGQTAGVLLLVLVGYFALMVFVYSVFKLLVMKQVGKYFRAKPAKGGGAFWRFFIANAVLFGIYTLAFVIMSTVFVMVVKVALIDIIRSAVLVALGFFLYIAVGAMHPLFMMGMRRPLKLSLKAINTSFNRLRQFAGLVGFSLVAFFALSAAYYAWDWIILLLLGDAVKVQAVYWGYAVVNTLLAFIMSFGLIGFNRIYFYSIMSRMGTKNI